MVDDEKIGRVMGQVENAEQASVGGLLKGKDHRNRFWLEDGIGSPLYERRADADETFETDIL